MNATMVLTSILVVGVLAPDSLPVSASPTRVVAPAEPALRVAKRRKKKRKKKKSRSSGDSVQVHASLDKVRWRVKKKRTNTFFVLPAGSSTKMEITGQGSLALMLARNLDSPGDAAEVTVTLDSGEPRVVVVDDATPQKGKQVEGPSVKLSLTKRVVTAIPSGAHQVVIAVSPSSPDVAVRIEHTPRGRRKPARVVMVGEDTSMAVATAEEEEEEGEEGEEGEATAALEAIEAVPTDAGVSSDLPDESDEGRAMSEIERKVQSGEIRDGLIGEWAPILARNISTGETQQLSRVPAQQSYEIVVGGPGTLTIRFYQLIGPGQEGRFNVVIMENDAVLHRLEGDSKPNELWTLASVAPAADVLGQAREVRLKLGDYVSRYAVQISAGAGMAVRYEFAAEALSLADIGLGDMSGSTPTTSVAEVELQEKVVEKIVYRGEAGDLLTVSLRGCGALPEAGGMPSFGGGLEFDFVLPVWGRRMSLGLGGGFEWHQLTSSAWDAVGVTVPSRARVATVPMAARFVLRQVFVDMLSVYGSLSGGILYLGAETRSLGSRKTASKWRPFGEAGGGVEVKLGVGWLGVQSTYRLASATAIAELVDNYSPGGATFSLHYRVGL